MALRMRQGLKRDFDPRKMLPGEWAVSTDSETENQIVWMCFQAGVVKRMGTYEDFRAQIAEATEDIRIEYAQSFDEIKEYMEGLKADTEGYKNTALSKATAAANSATEAQRSSDTAAVKADEASDSAKDAEEYSRMSESYARGTGNIVRPGDNMDNSKFYSELAQQLTEEGRKLLDQAQKVIAAATQGALIPAGTVAFAGLPTDPAVGFMYNISDDFTTDSRFAEGAGIFYRAGANVYWTADGKWDVMTGVQVTGVKGAKESVYRVGNVNITPENIGSVPADNVDAVLSKTSVNPIQNKPVAAQFEVLEQNTWGLTGGIEIPADADLNEYMEVGNYYCSLSNVAQTLLNCPVNRAFTMKIFKSTGTTYVSQLIVNYQTHERFYRRETGLGAGLYGDWIMLDHPLVNNLTTQGQGQGALDAHQGMVLKSWIDHYYYGTRIEFQTTQEMINYLESYSENILNTSAYKIAVKSAESIEPYSGIVWIVEGYRHNDKFEYQVMRSYHEGHPEIVRQKYQGVWSQRIVAEKEFVKENYQTLTQYTDIPEGADMKSSKYLIPGNYCCNQTSKARTLKNCPLDSAFTLNVFFATGTSAYIMQEFNSYTGSTFVRRTIEKSSGTWLPEYKHVAGETVRKLIS